MTKMIPWRFDCGAKLTLSDRSESKGVAPQGDKAVGSGPKCAACSRNTR